LRFHTIFIGKDNNPNHEKAHKYHLIIFIEWSARFSMLKVEDFSMPKAAEAM
jgi:hypothetical protein